MIIPVPTTPGVYGAELLTDIQDISFSELAEAEKDDVFVLSFTKSKQKEGKRFRFVNIKDLFPVSK